MPHELSIPATAKVLPGQPFFDLIEEAYQVFSVPKPRSTEVCEACCMDPQIAADFFKPSIADLPLNYIRDWYNAAYDPNGIAKETWTYLLPRIFEILASGEEVSPIGVEISLNRFETGNPANWASREWDVIDRFQRAYLSHKIGDSRGFIDDEICMFRLAGWPLDGILSQVSTAPDATLATRLWHDWCDGRLPGGGNVWISCFWEDSEGTQAFDFYTSRAMYDRMEALALSDDTAPDLAAKASAVADVIAIHAASRR